MSNGDGAPWKEREFILAQAKKLTNYLDQAGVLYTYRWVASPRPGVELGLEFDVPATAASLRLWETVLVAASAASPGFTGRIGSNGTVSIELFIEEHFGLHQLQTLCAALLGIYGDPFFVENAPAYVEEAIKVLLLWLDTMLSWVSILEG